VKPLLSPAPSAASAFPGCVILPIGYCDPTALCAAHAARPGTVWLDSAATDHPASQRSILAFAPRQTFRFTQAMVESPFDSLKNSALAGDRNGAAVIGYLGYETAARLERLQPPKPAAPALPEAWFGVYDAVAVFDHAARTAFVAASGWPETEPPAVQTAALERARAFAAQLVESEAPPFEPWRLPWTPERSPAAYGDGIGTVLDYIRAGDIYQANLSLRFQAQAPRPEQIFDLYRRLRTNTAAPFGSYLRIDRETALLSASPERFLHLAPDGRVRTQPIKGTRPRASDPAEDRRLRLGLRENTKERAENLMIVDLMRNDLSRVCAPGTVTVPSLFAVESFPTVHHLVSTVEGRLQPNKTASDLLAACFPGGSVTGAPKIRAMEIIRELEVAPRGAYCGSLLLFTPDGAMDSSILIRTVSIADGVAVAQAGSGIVADSDPAAEVRETWLKARALLKSLDPASESDLWAR
jgi:para-aminobenzoate synthetase component 1